MRILGISCFYHDAAAALLEDGQIVAAAQEERFTRLKHDPGFPQQAIQFCLEQGRITAQDLDYVVFYEKPFLKFERLLFSILSTFPLSYKVFRESMLTWWGEKLWVKNLIRERLGVEDRKILFCEHHLSHAASAFFCSPFEEAAVLTIDGVGEYNTATMGRGTARWDARGRNELVLTKELHFPHSLGLLYSAFTAFLGFEVNEGEYKVMGMAPYGKPNYVDKVYKLIKCYTDGSFSLDMSYFSYHYHSENSFNGNFVRLFGEPRSPQARFVTEQTGLYADSNPPSAEEISRSQHYADVAASIQKVLEEIVVKMANTLYKETGIKKLCMAGGVALNSVANYKVLQETPFEEIYIQPAAGDAGGAVGAALYVYHVLLGKPRSAVMDHAYLGKDYREDVPVFLKESGIKFTQFEDDERLMGRVVEALTSGKVVGWYQGRFEWGPRALGNRSILADPRQEEMKDVVNMKIKFREPFRPFAPSVLVERTEEFFDIPCASKHYPARFMLYVVPVRKGEKIPAVTHVDGTGRLQTVYKEQSPRYYRLIEKFGEATGVPVLLNTSFNLKGEPIVTTPGDAFSTFARSGIDLLVLEDCLVEKREATR